MKKILIISFGVLAVVIIAAVLLLTNNTGGLKVITDKCSYSDYAIEGDKVYIYCGITVKNSSSGAKTFQLNAIMKDDVELGLLKAENIKGYNSDLTSDIFTIEKKTTDAFPVVFVGDFAGTNKKHDRLVPEIVITEVE